MSDREDGVTLIDKASNPPRICILTQYFPPEMGAPQARLSELGERLIDRGWDVEALTSLPNYPTGQVFDGYDPSQAIVETIGRIRTVRVPLYTSKGGFTKRIRSYFSFVRSAKKYGPRLCQRPDVLLVESPPLFIGYAAKYLARTWQCPYVFNVSDLWPESAIRMGVVRPGLLTWLAERLELNLYRNAAAVTGQSNEIVESVRRRVPAVRAEVITNGVDASRFGKRFADDQSRQLLGNEPGPIFIYAGLLGLAQGLDQILDVAVSLPATTPGRFVIIGDGPERERLEQRIQREAISRVRILPAQPRNRIPACLAASDAAIITLGKTIPGAVPSKIYEAMASELPILLIADGEAATRISNAECGIAIRPNDLIGAKDAVVRLATDPELRASFGKAGRSQAETTYNRDAIAERLDNLLRQLVS
jgi:glycosyltransferase involved in cell wall biosynthesis